MAARLGNDAAIISRIGKDRLGEMALAQLTPFPIDCSQLQIDPELPTGQVTVELLEGQPSYTIHEPVAWDALEMTDVWGTRGGKGGRGLFRLAGAEERAFGSDDPCAGTSDETGVPAHL